MSESTTGPWRVSDSGKVNGVLTTAAAVEGATRMVAELALAAVAALHGDADEVLATVVLRRIGDDADEDQIDLGGEHVDLDVLPAPADHAQQSIADLAHGGDGEDLGVHGGTVSGIAAFVASWARRGVPQAGVEPAAYRLGGGRSVH